MAFFRIVVGRGQGVKLASGIAIFQYPIGYKQDKLSFQTNRPDAVGFGAFEKFVRYKIRNIARAL